MTKNYKFFYNIDNKNPKNDIKNFKKFFNNSEKIHNILIF